MSSSCVCLMLCSVGVVGVAAIVGGGGIRALHNRWWRQHCVSCVCVSGVVLVCLGCGGCGRR